MQLSRDQTIFLQAFTFLSAAQRAASAHPNQTRSLFPALPASQLKYLTSASQPLLAVTLLGGSQSCLKSEGHSPPAVCYSGDVRAA